VTEQLAIDQVDAVSPRPKTPRERALELTDGRGYWRTVDEAIAAQWPWWRDRVRRGDWPRPADRASRRRHHASTPPAGTAATPPTRAIGDRDADRVQPAATPTAMGVVEASPPTTQREAAR
jgi:hypothetical protein